MFIILKKVNGNWFTACEQKFHTPTAAQAVSKSMATDTGIPHRIQRVENPEAAAIDWREREQSRINDGTYTAADWPGYNYLFRLLNKYPDHFAHVSKDKPGFVAFTESPSKGEQDRQLRMTTGRYLVRFYSRHLTGPDIARLAALTGDKGGFEILTETKDIVTAYVHGPNSCMGKGLEYFSTGEQHPTAVYGGNSDVKLAVLTRNGEVTARAIVWPEKLQSSTIYGDADRMRPELHALGYSTGQFNGAKLNRIETKYGDTICAYLDWSADGTDGLLGNGCSCSNCGDSLSEEDLYHSEHGDGPYCDSCYYEMYARCEHCETETDRDDVIYIDSEGISVCSCCASDSFYECDDCGDWHPINNVTEVNDSDKLVCSDCLEKYSECGECGEHSDNKEIHTTKDGDTVCDDCHDPELHDEKDEDDDEDSEAIAA